MKKIMIHSQYDPAPCRNADKVYDRHDNVDRLSYVDNTMMIKRFVQEGRSLAEARAKALRSGTYLNAKDALSDDSGMAIPVYATDPAVAEPIIRAYKEKIKTAKVAKSNDVTSGKEEAKATEAVNDSSTNN